MPPFINNKPSILACPRLLNRNPEVQKKSLERPLKAFSSVCFRKRYRILDSLCFTDFHERVVHITKRVWNARAQVYDSSLRHELPKLFAAHAFEGCEMSGQVFAVYDLCGKDCLVGGHYRHPILLFLQLGRLGGKCLD